MIPVLLIIVYGATMFKLHHNGSHWVPGTERLLDYPDYRLWLIDCPIICCNAVSLILFVRLVHVMLSKIFAKSSGLARDTLRLLQSILMLIPLLGLHYTFTNCLWLKSALLKSDTTATYTYNMLETTQIIIDVMFTSIEGFLVAGMYCFCNGEVRSTFKAWLGRRDQRHRRVSRISDLMGPVINHMSLAVSHVNPTSRLPHITKATKVSIISIESRKESTSSKLSISVSGTN